MSKYLSDVKSSVIHQEIQFKTEQVLKQVSQSYDENIAFYVQEQTKKYEDLQREKQHLQKIIEKLEFEISEMKRIELQKLETIDQTDQEALLQMIENLQKDKGSLEIQLKEARDEMLVLKTAANPVKQNEQTQEALMINKTLLQKYQEVIQDTHTKNAELSKQLSQLKFEIESKNTEIGNQERQNFDLVKIIGTLKDEVLIQKKIRDDEDKRYQAEIQTIKEQLYKEIDIRNNTIDDINKKHNAHVAYAIQLEQSLRKDIKFRELLIDEMKKDILRVNNQKWKILDKNRLKIMEMEKDHNEIVKGLEAEIQEFMYQLGVYERRIVSIQEVHKKELEIISQKFEEEINSMAETQKDIIRDLTTELDSVRATNRQLQNQRKQNQKELTELREKIFQIQKNQQVVLDGYTRQFADLNADILNLFQEKNASENKAQEIFIENTKIQILCDEIEKNNERLEQEQKELTRYYAEKEQLIIDQHRSVLKDLEDKYKKQIYDIQTLRITDIKRLSDDNVRHEIKKEREFRERSSLMESELQNLRELFVTSDNNELLQRIAKYSKLHQLELEKVKSDFDISYNELKMTYSLDLHREQQIFQETLIRHSQEIHERKSKETELQIRQTQLAHQQELQKVLHEKNSINLEWTTKYDIVCKKHQDQVESLKVFLQHTKQLHESEKLQLLYRLDEADQQSKLSDERLENLREELRFAETRIKNFEFELKESNEILRGVEKQRETLTTQLTQERLLKQNISNQLIKNHSNQFTSMLEGHRNFVQDMQQNFIELDHRSEAQINILKQQLAESQEEFLLRPSRNQDIKKIEEVQNEAKVTSHELKYLLMQVINQEPLYNKIFIQYNETGFMDDLIQQAEILREVMKRQRTQFYVQETIEETLKVVLDDIMYNASIQRSQTEIEAIKPSQKMRTEPSEQVGNGEQKNSQSDHRTSNEREETGALQLNRSVSMDKGYPELNSQNQRFITNNNNYMQNNGSGHGSFIDNLQRPKRYLNPIQIRKATDISSSEGENSFMEGNHNNRGNTPGDDRKNKMKTEGGASTGSLGNRRNLESLAQSIDVYPAPVDKKVNTIGITQRGTISNINSKQNSIQDVNAINEKSTINEQNSIISDAIGYMNQKKLQQTQTPLVAQNSIVSPPKKRETLANNENIVLTADKSQNQDKRLTQVYDQSIFPNNSSDLLATAQRQK